MTMTRMWGAALSLNTVLLLTESQIWADGGYFSRRSVAVSMVMFKRSECCWKPGRSN
jgi:hypothetical protein